MSTDIIFDEYACWTRNSKGEPVFLLVEEVGCNNCSDFNGRIAREWRARAFGTFRQVVAQACRSARGFTGGTLQRGAPGGNSYREMTPLGYVGIIIQKLRNAGQMLGGLTVEVAATSRWAEMREKQAIAFHSANTIAGAFGIDLEQERVVFDLSNPLHVDAYLRFLQGECYSAYAEMRVSRSCPDRGVERADIDQFAPPKLIPHLGVVCFQRAQHSEAFLLPSEEPGVTLLEAWELAENIGQHAANAALQGFNPCAVFRALNKECASATVQDLTVTFSISENDKRSLSTVFASSLQPGVPVCMSLREAYGKFRWASFWSKPSTRIVEGEQAPHSRAANYAPDQVELFAA